LLDISQGIRTVAAGDRIGNLPAAISKRCDGVVGLHTTENGGVKTCTSVELVVVAIARNFVIASAAHHVFD
jgi:hypothetical protein